MKVERWRQVDELLGAALERNVTERSDFLGRACEGDEDLRREVESLLDAHLRAGSFIEGSPAEQLTHVFETDQLQSLVGQMLGHYKILSLLGTGGMGQVYRARDTRLGREVAVKVLPPAFTQDAERVRRFEQEARAASSLNHPNIITIYEVGHVGRTHFIAAELVEGRTLRQWMAAGRIKLSVALDLTAQVATALAAAHAAGIAHRDIKPENIMMRPDGLAKVLDFGLAKLVEQQTPPGDDPLTVKSSATLPGVVMGTVGYMSPEQVRAEKVDARTDIFSLGVVLYEVLAGRQPFRGDSAVEVMNAILKEDPSELTEAGLESRGSREQISPALERVVRRCLEKRPESRFQSASDLAFALKSLSDGSGAVVTSSTAARARSKARRWLTPAVAILAIITLAFFVAEWLRHGFRQTSPGQAVRLLRLTDFTGLEEFPAISPDGKSVAFTAEAAGKRHIWVRLLAGGPPLQITHAAADHLYPRWSHDSASLIYYSPSSEAERHGAIWELSMLGGPARRLTSSIGGADVSRDGKRLTFIRFNDGQIELAVSARDGSNAHALALLEPNFKYYYPRWSPDGEWVGYLRSITFDDDLFIVPAKGGEPRRIVHDRSMLRGFTWTEDSRGLVYSSSLGTTMLYLPSFNLWTVGIAGGEPRQLTFGESSYVHPDLNKAGAVVTSNVQMHFNIWKYPVDGPPVENASRAVQITHQTGQVQTPSVGPGDKEMVYLSDSGGHGNLWVMKLDSGEMRQITFERDSAKPIGVPVWSPDGKYIAFVIRSPIHFDVDLWLISPDGSGLRKVEETGGWANWSGDGRWLYYGIYKQGSPVEQIRKVSPEGGEPVDISIGEASAPAVAPDGTAIYFMRYLRNVNDSPDLEIYAARPENGPAHLLANIPGSRVPAWQIVHPVISPDGKWLALTLTDGGVTNLWALSTANGSLRQITDFGQRRTFICRRVSWSSDGRFIFAALGEGDADVVLLDGLLP